MRTGDRDPSVDPPVPLVDLHGMHQEVAEAVWAGITSVLSAGDFVGGTAVTVFENAFAAFTGRRHCVGMANGTDAIELALRALNVGQGHEVVLPANTFVATAEAVCRAGARPVFVDVTEDTLLIDPALVDATVSPRTVAVIPVHLYGQLAPMREIQEVAARHSLHVVEDAAQAQGARQSGHGVGHASAAAATSFYPGKNLGAYGDAGAVLSDDLELAQRVRRLGNHGSSRKYVHDELGFNSRLDTIQAVVLNAKLAHLATWNVERRAAAAVYDSLLDSAKIRLPTIAEGNEHVWHLYVIRVADRDSVVEQMHAQGIGVGIHYPVPVHQQPAFREFNGGKAFPVAEGAADEILSLPLYPGITRRQQERVAEALLAIVGS